MGNYALVGDLRNRLDGSGLTDELMADLCKTSVVATQNTYLNFLISNAEGLINAYLNKHYTTPIVTDQSDGFLMQLTCDLAEYDLFKRSMGNDVPTKVKDAWRQALDHLKMIIEGQLSPWGEDGAKNSSLDITTDTPRFDETSLEVF